MSFVKKNWKERIGTGLNKFFIGTEIGGKKELNCSPDTVTEQGDAFSALNFNNLESRIEAGMNEKQDIVPTDNYPVNGSNHLISSGAMFNLTNIELAWEQAEVINQDFSPVWVNLPKKYRIVYIMVVSWLYENQPPKSRVIFPVPCSTMNFQLQTTGGTDVLGILGIGTRPCSIQQHDDYTAIRFDKAKSLLGGSGTDALVFPVKIWGVL